MTHMLDGKNSKERIQLLKNRYSRHLLPRYIKNPIPTGNQDEVIDTDVWKRVSPEFIGNKYTGKWIDPRDDVINDTYLINKLLNYDGPLTEAIIPTSGGRRRHRHTKVKSKKRANKRRTRSRK